MRLAPPPPERKPGSPIAFAVQPRIGECPTLVAVSHGSASFAAQPVRVPVLVQERHRGEHSAATECLGPLIRIPKFQVQFGVAEDHPQSVRTRVDDVFPESACTENRVRSARTPSTAAERTTAPGMQRDRGGRPVTVRDAGSRCTGRPPPARHWVGKPPEPALHLGAVRRDGSPNGTSAPVRR